MRSARKINESEIGWLVFRAEQVEEARKVIRALQGEATVDSMGFGVLLERISDLFFPGTSTLHTWLRYKIFIPSIIYSIRYGKPKGATRECVRQYEYQLQRTLIEAAAKRGQGRVTGVIGKNKQLDLKYWPSMIYWNGLNSLRAFGPGYVDRFKLFDLLDNEKRPRLKNDDGSYEGDAIANLSEDPELVAIAQTKVFSNFEKGVFRENLDFSLSKAEADWFGRKYTEHHSRSLTAQLLAMSSKSLEQTDSIFDLNRVPDSDLAALLEESKTYSILAQGCTYAYNMVLCRAKGLKEGEDRNSRNLTTWLEQKSLLRNWDLNFVLKATAKFDTHQAVDTRFKRFVERCLAEIRGCRTARSLADALTEEMQLRERELKGNRSRFINPKIVVPRNVYAEQDYRPFMFDFRWSEGRSNLIDIAKGRGR